MANTILARRTCSQDEESLCATICNIAASERAIVNFSGRRPRMRLPSPWSRANHQHSSSPEFSASIVSGDTSHTIGQEIHVLYREGFPADSYVDSFTERWLIPCAFGFGGWLFAVIGYG